MAEVDKALEEEDNVDRDDENEEDEEGLVVAEVAHVEVLRQLLLQLFTPTFWSCWTRWNEPFSWRREGKKCGCVGGQESKTFYVYVTYCTI